jgi:peptidoglycan/LPS O-acetylase OafA/YrhL
MTIEAAKPASIGGHQAFRATNYFATLDVLRAVAVVAVIWHHTGALSFDARLAHRGYHGVTLFFAISGFLIVTLLLRETVATGAVSIRSFMIKRALRILPLYYATLLVYVVLVTVVEKDAGARAQFFANLPAFATFTTNWFVESHAPRAIFVFAWSLAAEEQFYLIWPWIERAKIGKSIGLWVALAAVALSPDFAGAFWSPAEAQPLAMVALSRLPGAIGLGVILAHLLHNLQSFRWLAPLIGRRGSALAGAFFLMTALYFGDALGRAEPGVVALLCMFLVGAVVIRPDNDLAVLQHVPGVVHIGTVSYGLYLVHMLSANAVKLAGGSIGFGSGVPWFVAAFFVALGVASVSNATFERYMLSLRGRFLRGQLGGVGGPAVHQVQGQQAFAR